MSAESQIHISEPTRQATHAVHTAMQFLRVVRYRQTVLVASMVITALLGGLYYATATRFYQAKASLLVLQTGADVTNTNMTAEGVRQGLMPTYERLFSSAVVLDGAIKHLAPEDRVDLEKHPPESWPTIIRNHLLANTIRLTNIIEVSYRSKSPRAAVAIVNAVLRSYLEFMDKTHKGTAGELIKVFTKEKVEVERRLAEKQQEVLEARQRFGDLGIRAESNVMHPLVQRVIDLNQSLIKTQEQRIQDQATLGAIEAAVRNGDDLQQHVLSLENSVGREVLLSGLGFNAQDVTLQANLEKSLMDDQAELRTLQEYYGPMHPRVMQVNDRIRSTHSFLSTYQTRVNQRLAQMREKHLGPLLIQMIQQRLNDTWRREAALRANFEQARGEAVALIGQRERLQLLEHDLKFLRDLRDVLLEKIASTDLRQDHNDIRTAVVSEPVTPKSPVWPRLPLVAAGCLAAGLAGGLGLIYILDVLDDRFRSPDELRTQLGIPVLAMVRQMEELHSVGLENIHVHVSPDAVVSEAFRTLRTTLAFSGKETSRLVISSSEPGDGKTTVLSNLAMSFCQAGKRVLLIDADMRRPGMSSQMGLKGQSGLSDFLVTTEPVAESAAAQVRVMGGGLDFIPAGARRPNPAELLSGPRFAELLAWAEANYDQVLVDSPPALAATDTAIIGQLVDGVILVVQPQKNRRRLVVRAAETFTSVGVDLIGVVINRIGNDSKDAVYGYGTEYGYGYGYGYGAGYGQESQDDNSQPNSVPRRVA